MRHSQLIRLAQQLGYQSVTDGGLCKGFTGMWLQAVCSNNLKQFNDILKLLERYADKPATLQQHIELVRKRLMKDTPLSSGEQKILSTLSLTEQQILLNVPAFFEGIALYLTPEIGTELFGDKQFYQYHQTEISTYLQSAALTARGGLAQAFCTTDQYDQQQLTHHLTKLSQTLQGVPEVAIELSANNHSIAIRVMADGRFKVVDTNRLDEIGQLITSKQLARKLNESFGNGSWLDWLGGAKPLIMTTSIFTNQQRLPKLQVEQVRETSSLTRLALNPKKMTMLQFAARYNDLATLKRIDFKTGHVPPLAEAILSHRQEGFNYLLTIDGIDVNRSQIPGLSPLCAAVVASAYDCARTIINHPSFKKASSIEAGDNIFEQLSAIGKVTDEKLAFIKALMNRSDFQDDVKTMALYSACYAGNIDLVKLFIDHGAQLNTLTPYKYSPLHGAIFSGNKELVTYLLEQGCDRNALTYTDNSPLHFACAKGTTGNKAMVELLLNYPDDKPLDFNKRDKTDQLTPLGRACRNGHLDIIPLLLPHTTLSMADIQPDSPITQQVAKCDSETKKLFFTKALTCYCEDRQQQGNYLNRWRLGFTKKEKTAAASVLLDACQGKDVDLAPHQAALKNGRLAFWYTMYQQDKDLQPVAQKRQSSSYEKMIKPFNITTDVPVVSELTPTKHTACLSPVVSKTFPIIEPDSSESALSGTSMVHIRP